MDRPDPSSSAPWLLVADQLVLLPRQLRDLESSLSDEEVHERVSEILAQLLGELVAELLPAHAVSFAQVCRGVAAHAGEDRIRRLLGFVQERADVDLDFGEDAETYAAALLVEVGNRIRTQMAGARTNAFEEFFDDLWNHLEIKLPGEARAAIVTKWARDAESAIHLAVLARLSPAAQERYRTLASGDADQLLEFLQREGPELPALVEQQLQEQAQKFAVEVPALAEQVIDSAMEEFDLSEFARVMSSVIKDVTSRPPEVPHADLVADETIDLSDLPVVLPVERAS